jgi:hypothetical protein
MRSYITGINIIIFCFCFINAKSQIHFDSSKIIAPWVGGITGISATESNNTFLFINASGDIYYYNKTQLLNINETRNFVRDAIVSQDGLFYIACLGKGLQMVYRDSTGNIFKHTFSDSIEFFSIFLNGDSLLYASTSQHIYIFRKVKSGLVLENKINTQETIWYIKKFSDELYLFSNDNIYKFKPAIKDLSLSRFFYNDPMTEVIYIENDQVVFHFDNANDKDEVVCARIRPNGRMKIKTTFLAESREHCFNVTNGFFYNEKSIFRFVNTDQFKKIDYDNAGIKLEYEYCIIRQIAVIHDGILIADSSDNLYFFESVFFK